jgi:hypothetical protein
MHVGQGIMAAVRRLFVVMLIFVCTQVYAQTTDSICIDTVRSRVLIAYPASEVNILPDFEGNRIELGKLNSSLTQLLSDTTATLRQMRIHSYGSPDGPFRKNERLARQRTDSLVAYVVRQTAIPQEKIISTSTAEDWDGLQAFVQKVPSEQLPHREGLLRIIRSARTPDGKEWAMKVTYPTDYRFLVENCLPGLRRADFHIEYIITRRMPKAPEPEVAPVVETPAPADTLPVVPEVVCPRLIAVKTNLLYDAVLIPNIGIEISLGKRWTVAADWFYTWFKSDNRHRYWQGYGGYLTVRKYFGGKTSQLSTVNCHLPFTGHHVGAYVSALTYDVEWGGRGYQAAKFGFGGGVEYGYSKRIGRRLCLDFTLGVGFQDGEYKEYLPTDDGTGHYVWQSTHKRHWWGPTKAEISLKWLIGRMPKVKKGGER